MQEGSLEGTPEPTSNTKSIELSTVVEEVRVFPIPSSVGTSEVEVLAGEEARVLPMKIGEGTSKARARASIEPIIIIFDEFPTATVDPIGPPPP